MFSFKPPGTWPGAEELTRTIVCPRTLVESAKREASTDRLKIIGKSDRFSKLWLVGDGCILGATSITYISFVYIIYSYILRNTESPARGEYDKVQLIHSFWQEPIDQSFFFFGQYPQRGKEGQRME